MKPPAFDYHDPETLDEALELLSQHGLEAKVLAGGQSLIPLLNLRLARPSVLVDLNRITDLAYLREDGGELAVGALARYTDVVRSQAVARGWPLVHEAAAQVGHAAIRNRATLAGSIAHADPAAELPAVLAALDGRIVIQGPGGRRTATPEEHFLGYLTTSLAPEEIVVEVRFPRLPAGPASGSPGAAFVEFSRRPGDFALAGVAAAVTLDAGGVCRDARLAACGVSGTPLRAREAEAALRGRELAGEAGRQAIREAAGLLSAAAEPDDDLYATARYKRRLVGVLAERALDTAVARAVAARAEDPPAAGGRR